jgi:hypothetical protein
MARTKRGQPYENRVLPDIDSEDYTPMLIDPSISNHMVSTSNPLYENRVFPDTVQEGEEVSTSIEPSSVRRSQSIINSSDQNIISVSNCRPIRTRFTNVSSTINNDVRGSPDAQRATHNDQCNDSDGANFCDCQQSRGKLEQCMFYGRSVEPLAFTLENKPVDAQEQCPLFSTIPTEIRDIIFEYALTDCTSNPFDSEYRFELSYKRHWPSDNPWPLPDIAFPLLQSCRRIYLEAYQFPYLSNPQIVYDSGNQTLRPNPARLAPWQFALIQSLDIRLQQYKLEGSPSSALMQYPNGWCAEARHKGAVVVARFYKTSRSMYPRAVIQSLNFGLLPNTSSLLDGDKISLEHNNTFYSETMNRTSSKKKASARIMVARPLAHLTLRLGTQDWWTWTDHSATKDTNEHLGLDPTCGDGSDSVHTRATASRMLELASQRRAGVFSDPCFSTQNLHSTTWGLAISRISSLKSLTLVLRTFGKKKAQLETVVECAKTWKFPLYETNCDLVWGGKVEDCSYELEPGKEYEGLTGVRGDISRAPADDTDTEGDYWWHERRVEVRVVRFVRRVREG